jgi:hypothetical protein
VAALYVLFLIELSTRSVHLSMEFRSLLQDLLALCERVMYITQRWPNRDERVARNGYDKVRQVQGGRSGR